MAAELPPPEADVRSGLMADPRIEFFPTPNEIAAACEEIQATWTEEERCKRRGGHLTFDQHYWG